MIGHRRLHYQERSSRMRWNAERQTFLAVVSCRQTTDTQTGYLVARDVIWFRRRPCSRCRGPTDWWPPGHRSVRIFYGTQGAVTHRFRSHNHARITTFVRMLCVYMHTDISWDETDNLWFLKRLYLQRYIINNISKLYH